MINFSANYKGIDKERYDAGNKFLSLDPYLQNYQNKPTITFNSSQNNVQGIPSQYPYPYPPIIPQGDGDGGGKTFGIDKGEITADNYGLGVDDQTGMGHILTEEDKQAIAQQKNKNRLTQAAQLGLFALNPMGYMLGKGATKAFNWAKDKFTGGGDGGGDEININKDNVFTKESIDRSFAGEEGPTGGGSKQDDGSGNFEQDGTGRQGWFYGGRIGYSGGGSGSFSAGDLLILRKHNYDPNEVAGWKDQGRGLLNTLKSFYTLRANGGIVGLYR